MNEKEINAQIAKDLKRIKALEENIENIKFNIEATKKAIEFWYKELDKASKK